MQDRVILRSPKKPTILLKESITAASDGIDGAAKVTNSFSLHQINEERARFPFTQGSALLDCRGERAIIAYPPEADRRHRPVMNTVHFDLRSHILRSDRRCSAEGMQSGYAHWNPLSPPARGCGEMLSTPYSLHRPFSTKCRKDFFRKELHALLSLGKVDIHKGHCGEMRNSGIDVLLG